MDLAHFAATFEAVAREQLSPAELARVRESDGMLAPSELTLELAQRLAAQVWGQGYPSPSWDDVFEVPKAAAAVWLGLTAGGRSGRPS